MKKNYNSNSNSNSNNNSNKGKIKNSKYYSLKNNKIDNYKR